jgi:hypothetical protein
MDFYDDVDGCDSILFDIYVLTGDVGTGENPGFNATTTHQQNPNYRPFRQHLRRR